MTKARFSNTSNWPARESRTIWTAAKCACEIELGDETGFPHKGLLDFVDNHLDPATGTLRVRGVFKNPDRVLQPGFFVRARVPGSSKYPALLISDQAVGTDQSQKFVFIS